MGKLKKYWLLFLSFVKLVCKTKEKMGDYRKMKIINESLGNVCTQVILNNEILNIEGESMVFYDV